MLDHIFALYKEASSIRQECGITANSILGAVASAPLPDSAFASALLQSYRNHSAAKTPEGLAAWFEAQSIFPKNLQLPKDVWHRDDPLDPKERSTLIQILRDNTFEQNGDAGATFKTSTGQAQRSPCMAWETVLKAVVQRSVNAAAADKPDPAFFTQFWREAVDGMSPYPLHDIANKDVEAFFSAKASSERKSVGLQIVRLGVLLVPSTIVAGIFSPNVIRCIINQRSSPSNTLHAAAELPLKTICLRARQQPQSALSFLTAIISKCGLVNFDKLTRTKTVDELLSLLPAEETDSLLEHIDDNIRKPKTSEHLDVEVSQRSSADLLLTLVRKQHLPPTQLGNHTKNPQADIETPLPIFPWTKLFGILTRHAYLAKGGLESMPEAIREVYQARTMSCLTHTLDSSLDPNFDHAAYIVATMSNLVKSGKYNLVLQADGTVLDILAKSVNQVVDITKEVPKALPEQRPTLQAFKLLFSLSVLQAHSGDGDAVSILEELHDVHDMWTKSKNTSTALIEILLGFLSRPSALFRKLAQQVFAAISAQVGADGLHALLDILEKPENLSGQQELFENADEVADELAGIMENSSDGSADSSEDDSSDNEDASDVEMIEANGDVESGDASASGEDSSEGGDDTSSDEGAGSEPDDELTAFESKLAQTLGTNKPVVNGDAADSDSDESDMDDDQMMQLDGHLTKIFQERTKLSNKKKDNRDAKGTVVNFKSRVLDLLTVFVKQCYSRPLILETIVPLLQLTRTTSNKELSSRAFTVLKSLSDTCNKHKTWPEVEEDELFTVLAAIHKELKQSNSKVHASAASRSSLFVVKVAITKDRQNYERAADMYTALQKDWYAHPRSKIPNSVFTEWTSWSISSRK